MTFSHDSFLFWAKTYPGPLAYKPVLHHLLDVAAVAASYLNVQDARLRREAALLKVEPEGYAAFVALLAGLHDLGKFTRNFQAKVLALWPATLGEWPGENAAGAPHWRATGLMLRLDPLRKPWMRLSPNLLIGREALLAAIAGHHGRPPPDGDDEAEAKNARRKAQGIDEACLSAAAYAFDALLRLTAAKPMPALDPDNSASLSWRLSGLITLADWVGSDADHFPPVAIDTPLDDYWRDARQAAARALRAKGLAPLPPASAPGLERISARAAASPRPMQRLAQDLKLQQGPQLILIEDATGSGKTEAALLMAARMIEAGLGEGVYFALPTMATANAMHKRLGEIAPRLFADNARAPSVILSHGKAKIAEALAKLKVRPAGDEEGATAASCNDWIADDRRRAFFADVGAGTIDQAFLAVLPKKHLTLRQYALAGRILIIDEAHCFDAYMKEELDGLLRLHAMNGGSAIVLSATLALDIRRQIAKAWFEGLGFNQIAAKRTAFRCASSAYPLLTHLSRETVAEHGRPLDPSLSRKVHVERLDNRDASVQAAGDAADHGAAVLILCNAVEEAIALYRQMAARRREGTVHLFHARFAQCDRLAIEDKVMALFGRDATDRAGNILVATQVVEQSLDLDFDLIITDLAPIDLLIQRAGRLWRHMDLRPASARAAQKPRLLVVSPDPDGVSDADWLQAGLGKAAFVYPRAGVMWRSAKAIFSNNTFSTPEDLRPLIERVYGGDAEPVPACLEDAEGRGEGKEGKAKAIGALNVIKLDAGYGGLPCDLRADENIGARLGEPSKIVRLARWRDGVAAPWHRSGGDYLLDWASSELGVPLSIWKDATPLAEDEIHLRKAREGWTEYENDIVLAPVDEDGRVRVAGPPLRYASEIGLWI